MNGKPKVRCHFCGCIVRATRLAKHVLEVHGLQDEIKKLTNQKHDEEFVLQAPHSIALKDKPIERLRHKSKLKKKRIKEHMYSWFAQMSNARPMPGGIPGLGKNRKN